MEPKENGWDFTGVSVIIAMGSNSDWLPCMKAASAVLADLGVAHTSVICSAHRTPGRVEELVTVAEHAGVQVIIAGAGGAAHLAGTIAGYSVRIPVLGVPVKSGALSGLDSLLSTVQMPGAVPVATFSIGDAGARNAGIFAAMLIGLHDGAVGEAVAGYRSKQTEGVPWTPSD